MPSVQELEDLFEGTDASSDDDTDDDDYLHWSCFGPGPVLDHFFKFLTNFARLAVVFNRIGWYS